MTVSRAPATFVRPKRYHMREYMSTSLSTRDFRQVTCDLLAATRYAVMMLQGRSSSGAVFNRPIVMPKLSVLDKDPRPNPDMGDVDHASGSSQLDFDF